MCVCIFIQNFTVYKVGDRSRGRPEEALLNGYYTELKGGCNCFLGLAPLILDTYLTMLSVFRLFHMSRPVFDLRSPEPLANTVPTWPIDTYP